MVLLQRVSAADAMGLTSMHEGLLTSLMIIETVCQVQTWQLPSIVVAKDLRFNAVSALMYISRENFHSALHIDPARKNVRTYTASNRPGAITSRMRELLCFMQQVVKENSAWERSRELATNVSTSAGRACQIHSKQ